MLSYKKQVQVFIKMLYYVPWKDNRQLYISLLLET